MPNDTQAILNLKEALEKELLPKDSSSVERCKDILDRLNEFAVDMDILTETLIGATVNKLKTNKDLGATVKALVKKWKKVAAGGAEATKKAQRRESLGASTGSSSQAGDNGNYDPESEWQGLPGQRYSMCQKLYGIFLAAKPGLLAQGVNEAAIQHVTAPRTAELEGVIHNKYGNDRKGYADKARSIFFNLKKNQSLAVSLLLGHLEPAEIVEFSPEQLASDDIRKKREETAKKLIDSKRLDWDQANEDKINKQCGISGDLLSASLFTCGRCKSVKTTSTQKQTRSADEPMTVFVLCLNCGKRWKC